MQGQLLVNKAEVTAMTANQARKILIVSSLVITGGQLIFFLVAPSVGFPLAYPMNLSLLQIISPLFLGYLGAAAHFVFKDPTPQIQVNNEFLGVLVVGPVAIYFIAVIAAFGAFRYSNREGAPIPGGISVENLSTALSIILSVLAATTSVLISYLFAANRSEPLAAGGDVKANRV
jgi:hypothetical protein